MCQSYKVFLLFDLPTLNHSDQSVALSVRPTLARCLKRMQAGGALKVAPVSVRAHVVALQQQQLTANVAKKNQSSSEAQFYWVSIKRSMEAMRS